MTEKILCAAIWFNDETESVHQPKNILTGFVACGYRHGSIFSQMGMTVNERKKHGVISEEQGFLTSKNRFVDRIEAAKIAISAKQVKEDFKGQLYSEDLY